MIIVQSVLVGLLLKPLLAWRMLDDEVANVEHALESGVESGRDQLKRLVSRNTAELSATEVRESALESLAENLNDSLVAPLFWFCLGGLPAAALYRFANTADAMWGYRGRWSGRAMGRASGRCTFLHPCASDRGVTRRSGVALARSAYRYGSDHAFPERRLADGHVGTRVGRATG